jgi:L-amino acid N-acyltransferase YncA
LVPVVLVGHISPAAMALKVPTAQTRRFPVQVLLPAQQLVAVAVAGEQSDRPVAQAVALVAALVREALEHLDREMLVAPEPL